MARYRNWLAWSGLLFLLAAAIAFAVARSTGSASSSDASIAGRAGYRELTALGGTRSGGLEKIAANLAEHREHLHRFEGLSPEDMPLLFAELLEARSNGSSQSAFAVSEWSLLLSQWAEIDPQGGLAFLVNWDGSVPGRSYSLRDSTIATFLANWATHDPSSALAAALGLEDDGTQTRGVRYVMSAISQDPVRFFELVKSLPDSIDVDHVQGYALARLAKVDIGAALRQLDQLPASARAPATGELAAVWAENDPAAALRWARSLGDSETSLGPTLRVLTSWAAQDPWIAAEHFVELKAAGQLDSGTSTLVITLLRTMGRQDIDRAVEWSAKHLATDGTEPPRFLLDARSELVQLALLREGEISATVADELIAGLGRGQFFTNSLPDARIAEITNLLEARISEGEWPHYSVELARRWHAMDPAAAEAFIGRMPTPEMQQRAWIRVASAEPDIGAALQLLQRAPGDVPQEEIAQLLLGSPAAEAVGHLDLLEGGERIATVGDLAQQWADSDPRAAVDWAIGLGDPTEQNAALWRIGATWSEHDYARSSAWVATLAPGPGRDYAISGMLSKITGSEPEAAVQWALAIDDAAQRASRLTEAFASLHHQSPASAIEIFENLDLPEELRQQIGQSFRPTAPAP